jgi:hypothetical protein
MMEIYGKIVSKHANAGCIAESLSADNLRSMETKANGDNVLCEIRGNKLRSIIASVDDYLMNLSIAEDICNLGHNTNKSESQENQKNQR